MANTSIKCLTCNGRGELPKRNGQFQCAFCRCHACNTEGAVWVVCTKCQGQRTLKRWYGRQACPDCNNVGQVKTSCDHCGGSGRDPNCSTCRGGRGGACAVCGSLGFIDLASRLQSLPATSNRVRGYTYIMDCMEQVEIFLTPLSLEKVSARVQSEYQGATGYSSRGIYLRARKDDGRTAEICRIGPNEYALLGHTGGRESSDFDAGADAA